MIYRFTSLAIENVLRLSSRTPLTDDPSVGSGSTEPLRYYAWSPGYYRPG